MKRFLSYLACTEWLEEVADRAQLDGDTVTADGRSCRLPLVLRHEAQTFEQLLDAIYQPPFHGLMLIQAGRASLAVAQADEILVSKQIQKYMVRKSQGKAQLTYLNEKGKSRLGSRIRLQQTQIFFDEINERMRAWSQEYPLESIFLSCTPKLKGAFFQSVAAPAIPKNDSRWRRVPFMVRPPGLEEMRRIHRLLCRAEWLS